MKCYGCETLGYCNGHDVTFTDSRTGRAFCHECAAALITWELDDVSADGLIYDEWVSDSD